MIDIGLAIKEINKDAEHRIEGLDWNTLTWLNNTTPISQADIEAKQAEMETAKTNEATAKASAKASGNTKLLGLGLTQAEATALTGFTPE